jgi:hypothetical protein
LVLVRLRWWRRLCPPGDRFDVGVKEIEEWTIQ